MTKTHQDVVDSMRQANESLAAKGTLLLTVKLETAEQADEIMRWMYASEKPMSAELVEIAWDKVAVRKDQAEALAALLETSRP